MQPPNHGGDNAIIEYQLAVYDNGVISAPIHRATPDGTVHLYGDNYRAVIDLILVAHAKHEPDRLRAALDRRGGSGAGDVRRADPGAVQRDGDDLDRLRAALFERWCDCNDTANQPVTWAGLLAIIDAARAAARDGTQPVQR